MNLKISIIIPFYNDHKNFERLISSIPERQDIEVIVIDDHSDKLPLLQLARNNVKIVIQDSGKKWAGAARNKGLDLAKGQYILFADSDDYFIDNAFDIIEEYTNKNHDIVFFSPTSILENGGVSLRHTQYATLVSNYVNNSDESIRYEFIVPWSKLYRAEIIVRNNIRFDEVIASNDVMFSLKTGFFANNIEAINKSIYCVVESSTSLTKSVTEAVVDSRFAVLCSYNEFVKEHLESRVLISAVSCISRARKISFFKMLSVLCLSLHKGYPIFPTIKGFKRWIKRSF